MNAKIHTPYAKPLDQKWIDYLKEQPETGMGYQMVSVTMADGSNFGSTVLNAEHLLVDDGFPIDKIEKIDVLSKWAGEH